MSDTFSPTKTQITVRTKAEYVALRDALEHYCGGLLGLPDAKDVDGKWFEWSNKKQFLDEISRVLRIDVSPENINKDLANKIYVDLTNREINAPKAVGFIEAEESPVNATVANEEVRDEQAIKSSEEKIELSKQDRNESNEIVRRALARKQELQDQKNQQNEVNQRQSSQSAKQELKEPLVEDFFAKTNKQVVVTSEDFTPTPSYVTTATTTPANLKDEYVPEPKRQETTKTISEIREAVEKKAIADQQKTDQQIVNEAKTINSFQQSVAQQQVEFNKKIEIASSTKNQLDQTPAEKVWIRVSVPTVTTTASQNQTDLNLYTETMTTTSPYSEGIIANQIIAQAPEVLENIAPNKDHQSEIKQANAEFTNQAISQYDLYRKSLVNQENVDPTLNIGNLKVEVLKTSQPYEAGFVEVNATQLFNDQVSSRLDSLESQNNSLNDLSSYVQEYGVDSGRAFLLEKAGSKLASHIASLPEGHFLRSEAAKFAFSQAGLLAPTQYAALTDSFMGDLIVASGNGELGGFVQSITGINLGLIEVGPLGVDMFAAGVTGGIAAVGVKAWAAQTTATYTGLAYQGNYMLADAYAGGAMQAAVTKAAGQVGKQSLNITLGTAVAKGASSLALKFGFTTASAQIAGAIGTGIIPVIGTIVGVIIGATFGKLIEKFGPQISRFIDKNKELLLVGGAMLLSTLPAVGAIAMIAGGASAIAAGGLSFGGMFLGIWTFFRSIGRFLLFRVGIPLIIGIGGFILLVIFILFIINNGAFVVPLNVSTNEAGTVGRPNIKVNCSKEKGPVGVPGPNSTSPIANRAWEIVYDLYQGFWCYWNRPPPAPVPYNQYFPNDTIKYPPNYNTSFDYEEYFRNPRPETWTTLQLFWCTYLVIRSYQSNNNSMKFDGADTNTEFMMNHFKSLKRFISAANATPSNIPPGSAIFFHVVSGHEGANHVGVVYSVNQGGIVFVESNNAIKSESIIFKRAGSGTCTPACLNNGLAEECGCNSSIIGVGNIGSGSGAMITLGFGLP